MDRDNRWERTELAYDAIVHGRGRAGASDPVAAIRAAYEADVTDEFVEPVVIGGYDGVGRRRRGDPLQLPPRPRAPAVPGARPRRASTSSTAAIPRRPGITTLTQLPGGLAVPGGVPAEGPGDDARRGPRRGAAPRQLHVAETEKYAHVTYFFNGGREAEWEGEERRLVDSPRDVPTYDHKPEMSAAAAAEAFGEHWRADGFRFGIINFANPDMVGHTGGIPAAVAAVEAVDGRLGEVVAAVHESGGACIVTADHGNADNMLEPDGSPNTAHSTNPVPLIVTVAGSSCRGEGDPRRRRADGPRAAGDRRAGRDDRPLAARLTCARTRTACASRSTPATAPPAPGACSPPTARSRPRPSCRWRPAAACAR